MNPPPAPYWLISGGRRLFAILHRPAAAPRGSALMCPPLFHEHARSYRLFALLADALAGFGLMVLRFDYYGTGDSDGTDTEFTLRDACTDSVEALRQLRVQTPDAPLAVLGVRAGAIPAVHAAAVCGADALWLWQPQTNGADVLADVQRRDAEQRRLRYGARHGGSGMSLMGFPHNAALPGELRTACTSLSAAAAPRDISVLDARGISAAFASTRRVVLADALHEWVDRMDMGRFPRAPLREIGCLLATSLERG